MIGELIKYAYPLEMHQVQYRAQWGRGIETLPCKSYS